MIFGLVVQVILCALTLAMAIAALRLRRFAEQHRLWRWVDDDVVASALGRPALRKKNLEIRDPQLVVAGFGLAIAIVVVMVVSIVSNDVAVAGISLGTFLVYVYLFGKAYVELRSVLEKHPIDRHRHGGPVHMSNHD